MPGREHPFMENPSRTLTVVNVIDFPAPFANGHEHRSDNVGLINAPFPLTKYTTWHNGTIENERPRPGCATLPGDPNQNGSINSGRADLDTSVGSADLGGNGAVRYAT